MNPIKALTTIAALSLVITGCGGGGSGSTPTPNGIYTGTITGGNASYNGDLGEKAIIYNNRLMLLSNNSGGVSQIFDANLTVTGSSLTGAGSRYDSGGSLLNSISYDGTFSTGQSATVNFSRTDSAVTLADGTMQLTATSAVYSKGSAASRLAGSWTGTFDLSFGRQMDLSLDANGTITSGGDQSPLDCQFTGSITPADASINVYNVTLTSDGGSSSSACRLPADDYTGLAWTEGDTDGTLVLMVVNTTQQRSRAVVLTKN